MKTKRKNKHGKTLIDVGRPMPETVDEARETMLFCPICVGECRICARRARAIAAVCRPDPIPEQPYALPRFHAGGTEWER
jgi:hypothetical protein